MFLRHPQRCLWTSLLLWPSTWPKHSDIQTWYAYQKWSF